MRTKNKSLTFCQRLKKQTPFFCKIYPLYNQERKHLKPTAGYVNNFSIGQIHQNNKKKKQTTTIHVRTGIQAKS